MRHHHHVIRGHRHIQLERVHADGQRGSKARQRVLGEQAARAAMALQIDRARHAFRVGRPLYPRQAAANAVPWTRRTTRCWACSAAWGPLASAQFMLRLTLLTPADARPGPHPRRAVVRPARAGPHGRQAERRRGSPALAAARHRGTAARRLRRDRHPVQHRARLVRRDAPTQPACRSCTSSMPPRPTCAAWASAAGTIGVMGTQATLAMRLYQDRLGALGWDCIVPSRGRDGPAGQSGDRAGEGQPGRRCLCAAGRGGTRPGRARGGMRWCWAAPKFPLGIQAGPAPDLPLVDTIDALARAAIEWAGK